MFTWWGLYRSVPYEAVMTDSDRRLVKTEVCAQEDQEASPAPGQVSLNSNSEQPGGQKEE